MTIADLKEQLIVFYPALALDDTFPRALRRRLRSFAGLLVAGSFFAVIVGFALPHLVAKYQGVAEGVFLISIATWMFLYLLEMFHRSFYFKDIQLVLRESRLESEKLPMTFAVAEILYGTQLDDVAPGFVASEFGGEVLARLGLDHSAITQFFSTRRSKVPAQLLSTDGQPIDVVSYARAYWQADKEFAHFLFSHSIQEKDFLGAARWTAHSVEQYKRRARWWGKDGLGRIPGIGKSWAYGQIARLLKYARELQGGIRAEETHVKSEVEKVEAILARSREANALIVADRGSGEMDVVFGLLGEIERGTVLPTLEGKRMMLLNTNLLIDANGDKAKFERECTLILNEAVRAGNILLVIADLPGFIGSARSIGSDLPTLLAPYLSSADLQLIAVADRGQFHQMIETNSVLMNAFEIVRVEQKDERGLVEALQLEVSALEARERVLFTYPALVAVAGSAIRYFTEGVALDKARDLLIELPPRVKAQKRRVVLKEDVSALVEQKTGVPAEGTIKEAEKEKLLNLEQLLHTHVVGQDEAITAIAGAMKRARAGLRNPNRPIGSFLFLGPTGVGKTETSKALAEIFFGGAAPMLRLDMSEYAGSDALEKMIGSSRGGSGVLSSMLRDQKYGVLLLDEFEKTNPEVLNLFLSILDEGFFSDATGKRVNARDVIVIATSNAGSDKIFEYVNSGKELSTERNALIEEIIRRGNFRPELINRFDGVILFHPLNRDHLRQIAKLMIAKLGKRLAEQGIEIKESPDLVEHLVNVGFDPKFGARPMNRSLQEEAEKVLAEKLIRGELEKGSTVAFYVTTAGNLDVQKIA